MKIQQILFTAFFLALALATLNGCASKNRPLQLIKGAGPTYPSDAKSQGVEGEVVVRYDVTTSGVVVNAYVVASSPPHLFDEAALVAVRSWKFNPTQENGEMRSTEGIESKVVFRLQGTQKYDGY